MTTTPSLGTSVKNTSVAPAPSYQDILRKLLKEDERFVVMTAENRGAIRNLPNEIGDRFFDTGITEQTMIGAAAGLALRGRIPITHALATFLTLRAFEFIRSDVGIGKLPVKMVGAVPGFLSEANGPTHQAIEDVSILRGIPNINVFCPADDEDMALGLEAVLKAPEAYYVRYNSRKAIVPHGKFEIGKAETFAEKPSQTRPIGILTYGTLFTECFHAKTELESKGHSVRLLNLRTVKPVDEVALLKAARECSHLITVEDHFKVGGLYSILAEILLTHQTTAAVLPLALDNRWFKPVLLNELLAYEGFTGPQISQKINEFVTQRRSGNA